MNEVVMWIVGGVLSALAGGLALFGALRKKKDEGLIEAPVGPLHWSKEFIPLMVLLDPELEHWEELVNAACMRWNHAVDRYVFLYSGIIDDEDTRAFEGRSPGIIIVRLGHEDENSHASLTFNPGSGEILAAPIRLRPEITKKSERVILHELGHVLGLAHDPQLPGSVMYPRAVDKPFEITDPDRELLREWYG